MSLQQELNAGWLDWWKLPERLTPTQWADRHRVLSNGESSEPGQWRTERTPYLQGIMDAVCEEGVEELTFVKPTQCGGSEAWRNILGYWIEEDPGPCLIVMPSEAAVKELLEERIKPLLFGSPSLRRHLSNDPHDLTQTAVHLDTMAIYFGWAGSPQSLATRPCRYVIFDECDKFPPFAGREADPISLGIERTATYGHRRRIIKVSTPTTRTGAIYTHFEASGSRRRFIVACPFCGEGQQLSFSQVRWPKLEIAAKPKLADAIEQHKLAYYECVHCRQQLKDHHKPKMLAGGKWEAEGEKSKKVGFHISAIASPWRSFSDIAGQFIRCDGDPGAMMNFRNSWLAEPFEDVATKAQPSVLKAKAGIAGKPGVVPNWAQTLIATADTQKDWFAFCIRAWGWGYKSALVYYGVCQSFDELYKATLEAQFAIEGKTEKATPIALLIDSGGNRTDEVYQFALRDPGRIKPTKGAAMPMRKPWTMSHLPSGTTLFVLDVGHYKDMLSRLIADPDQTKWLPHSEVNEQYLHEMASEHKIVDRKNGRLIWVPISSAARVEAWDCEVLQCAAADMANVGAMPAEVIQTAAPVASVASVPFGGNSRRW